MSAGARSYTNIIAGTINYTTGAVSIRTLTITSISDVDGSTSTKIRLTIVPNANDIVALRNQILEIDVANSTVTAGIDNVSVGDESGAVNFSATGSTVDTTGTSY